MPTGQQYATNVPQTNLTSGISASDPTMSVAAAVGWPATPFTATIDIGNSSQECVDVTNVTGTSFTITRAVDGTSAFAHGNNATVTHTDIGRDFRESRSHIDASTSPDATGHAVHGLANSSSVVGTTDTQTVSNKTISAATFTGNQAMGSGTWTGTGVFQENAVGVSGLTGAANTTRLAGATTAGGPPATGTFVTGDIVWDKLMHISWLCTAGGTPGTWAPMGRALFAQSGSLVGDSTLGVGMPTFANLFSSIRIEYVSRTSSSTGTGVDPLTMVLNSASNYNYEYTSVSQGGAVSGAAANSSSSMVCGMTWSSRFATPGAGRGWIEVPFAFETTFVKSINFQVGSSDGGATGSSVSGTGSWNTSSGTAAVSNISIQTTAGTWLAGSTFNFYLVP